MPESKLYQYWLIIVGLSNIISALLYPFCIGFGFPDGFPLSMDIITL